MSGDFSALIVRSFFQAISINSVEGVRQVLDCRPELLNAISSNYPYSGPIHAAAVSGSLDVLRLLAERGADLQGRNCFGRIALHYTMVWGREKVAKYLLETGSPINTRDGWGQTPLHIAAKYHRLYMIKLLIEAGALVDARDKQLRTPLMKAARADKAVVASQLIKAGAHIDAVDRRGRTALHFAAGRSPQATQLLIAKVAMLQNITLRGWTPLEYAVWNQKNAKRRSEAEASIKALRKAIAVK